MRHRRRRRRRLGLAVVRGRSMEPTLREGDTLLVLHGAVPVLGRMAVVRLPARTPAASGVTAPAVVAVKRVVRREPGGWWVERDNPAMGVDSWTVGPVADSDVVARVLCRLWPPRPPRMPRRR